MSTPDSSGSPDGRTYSAPETAGQAAREALRNRLIRAAGEIKNCRTAAVTCGPCETQIEDVLAAADAYAQAAIAAAAPASAASFEAWYAADSSGRTMAQDFTESKHDAMRRAFLAGTAAPAPAGQAQAVYESLLRAYNGHIDLDDDWECLNDDDHAAWRTAVGAAPAAQAEADAAADATYTFAKDEILANAGPEWDRPLVPETNAIEYVRHLEARVAQLDLARAETAGIRAAAANTARELLGEIGVMAANAPEDDAFAVCEDIAMRIAAAGMPGEESS